MPDEKIGTILQNEINNHEISMSEISKRLMEYARDTKNKALHANRFAELLKKRACNHDIDETGE